ncbi:MAG: hypothetical protein K9H61_14250 [Bacteroidia bacterium]|nr:hypothetical protein [Bacteroidia bacterium]
MVSEAHFKDISKTITDKIIEAKYSVCIAVTWLTDLKILNQLKICSENQIHVDIIIDKNDVNLLFLKTYEILVNSGVNMYFYNDKLMHNKFCIIDLRAVITGSYNYSNAAKNNSENILINREIEVVEKFIEEFKSIKKIATKINVLNNSLSNNFLDEFFDGPSELEKAPEVIDQNILPLKSLKSENEYLSEYNSIFEKPNSVLRSKHNVFNIFWQKTLDRILLNLFYSESLENNDSELYKLVFKKQVYSELKIRYMKDKDRYDKEIKKLETLFIYIPEYKRNYLVGSEGINSEIKNYISLINDILFDFSFYSGKKLRRLKKISINFGSKLIREEFIYESCKFSTHSRPNIYANAKKYGYKIVVEPNNKDLPIGIDEVPDSSLEL